MAKARIEPSTLSVDAFLAGVKPLQRREESAVLLEMLQRVTGETPVLWGTNIVAFGSKPYVYKSGKQDEWFRAGFSPQRPHLTVYLPGGIEGHADLLTMLGPHVTRTGCLYLTQLADIRLDVLEALVVRATMNY